MKRNFKQQLGQALVTLLFFVLMGITITTAAIIILITTIRSTTRFESGTEAYYIAESGADVMILQLLRNPFYQGTQTISVNGGVATVSAMQGNPITILSISQYNNFIRKVQVQTVYTNGKVTILSWKEVF